MCAKISSILLKKKKKKLREYKTENHFFKYALI